MNVGRGALAGCCALAVLILIAAIPGRASAQDSDDPAPSGQIWGDFRMVWPDDEGAWLFRIDLKPKVQFSGSEKWAKIVIDPAVEYSALRLLDLLGNAGARSTHRRPPAPDLRCPGRAPRWSACQASWSGDDGSAGAPALLVLRLWVDGALLERLASQDPPCHEGRAQRCGSFALGCLVRARGRGGVRLPGRPEPRDLCREVEIQGGSRFDRQPGVALRAPVHSRHHAKHPAR